MSRLRPSVVLAGLLVLATPAGAAAPKAAWAADAPTQQGVSVETLARACSGCHGIGGVSPGAIPTIAGKAEDYLVQRMTELRDGKRPSTIMGRVLKPFADEDIANLARYFATRK
jgi:sulfide dehydrogenase cytochrome subunit